MAGPYIPPKDADLIDWGTNFSDLITMTPAAFGLDAAAALTIQTAFDTFQAAYNIAVAPATRTITTVAQKNTDKQAFIGIARTYAAQIRLNPGVSNADKIALGLNLPNNSPTPIPPPSSNPLLTFVGATPGQHTLRYADSNTPDLRKKPQGAIGMQLFVGISTVALTSPADCKLYAVVTTQPVAVNFDPADRGKIATYFGRWQNRGKQAGGSTAPIGPWSNSLTATIP